MAQKKKYVFIIQGEGRGHLTQALALEEILRNAGHEVKAVLVGRSSRREIPVFFYEKIKSKIHLFESPNFWIDAKYKSVNIFLTIFFNIFRSRRFIKNIRAMHELLKEYKPDVVINFYDLLAGLYMRWYKPKWKFICIGHHYWMNHPDFVFPKGKPIHRWLLKLNNRMTSFRADKRLALSFHLAKDIPKKKLEVVPPLLRKPVFDLSLTQENFILIYLLNHGYADSIIEWHREHPDVKIYCFWDKKKVEDNFSVHPNLLFYRLDDESFLSFMSRCKGYICTAGFESVCEAFYLGKPVMVIPTKGHFEQQCNAIDAVRAGVGIQHTEFDISKFLEYLNSFSSSANSSFKEWVHQGDQLFVEKLTS